MLRIQWRRSSTILVLRVGRSRSGTHDDSRRRLDLRSWKVSWSPRAEGPSPQFERSPEKAGVGGSIPSLATISFQRLSEISVTLKASVDSKWSPNSVLGRIAASVCWHHWHHSRGSHREQPIAMRRVGRDSNARSGFSHTHQPSAPVKAFHQISILLPAPDRQTQH